MVHTFLRVCCAAFLVGNLPVLVACDREPPLRPLGKVYFAAGPYLGELSLATGDARPVRNFGDQRLEFVSDFEGGELLLSIEMTHAKRRHHRLVRFNPETLRETELFGGRAGQYLAESKFVVYMNGDRLFSAPRLQLRSGGKPVLQLPEREPPIVVTVGQAVVLVALPDGRIQRIQPDNDDVAELPKLADVCALGDAVWIEDHKQLLCRARARDGAGSAYILVTLDGVQQGELSLPRDRYFRPVVYLADQRMLVLNEHRTQWFTGRDEHPVWVYAFDSDQLQRVAKNQYLGNSAVYRR